MEHLLVLRIVIVTDYGHTIIQLERKGVDAVVDQDYVTEGSLVENSHVLNIEVRVARTDTTWSIIACLDELAFRIKVVNYRVCVLLF